METTENNITAERSLEIIRNSIEQSRRDIERGSWKDMMFWGIVVVLIALMVAYLWENTSMGGGANGLWGLCGIAPFLERRLLRKQFRKPATFISKTLGYVWGSFAIMAGSLGFICFPLVALYTKEVNPAVVPMIYLPITAMIILFMGLAGMISGRILGSGAITVCCFLSGALGSVAALVFPGPNEMIVLAAVSFVGLIIPALIIRGKEKKEAR
jgi:hypothetical protein